MRVLVTGATGAIGPLLITHLLDHGHRVRVLLRHSSLPQYILKNVDVFQGDVSDEVSLLGALDHAEAVFHLAAKLHINAPSPDLYDEYNRINVTGSANVAKAVVENRVKRMVHFSTINVYGPSKPSSALFDESSPLNPQSIYAESKIKAEKAVLDILGHHPSSSVVILRLAAVYGPRMQGNYKTLVKALKYRLFWPIGRGDNRRTLIYIDDLLRGAHLAAVHPNAKSNTYNLTDGRIHTLNQIIEAIAYAVGHRAPRFHIPENSALFISDAADKVLDRLSQPRARFRTLVEKMLEDVAVDGNKICRDLGFTPRVSLKQGWQKAMLG
jgi:UDP-glucose 4-epimerase